MHGRIELNIISVGVSREATLPGDSDDLGDEQNELVSSRDRTLRDTESNRHHFGHMAVSTLQPCPIRQMRMEPAWNRNIQYVRVSYKGKANE